MEFRCFYQKANFKENATASAYIETQDQKSNRSTKLSCAIYGPLQKSGEQGSNEECTIRVNIDFADTQISDQIILDQYPDIDEQLRLQVQALPSKQAADSVKEKKVKFLVGNLQNELQKILSSVVLVEKYPGTSLVFSFTIIELDCDILQSAVNCASVALYNSQVECRCLPVAVSMAIKQDSKQMDKAVQVDPNIEQIQNKKAFSMIARVIVNINTEEIIYSNLMSIGKQTPLELYQLEELIGIGMSCAKKIHHYIVK